MSNVLKNIPMAQIRTSTVALRPVDKESEKYQGLVDSIRKVGVMNPINVRLLPTPDNSELYGLIDGLHRFTGAGDAGLTEIPAQVLSVSDGDLIEAQIMANVHKIETKPVEYAKALQKLLAQNPLMTMSELATRLAKSPTWLSERLNLPNLDERLGALVDEGKITLSNAFVLAKLPVEDQLNFADRAMTQSPAEFVPAVQKAIKEIRDAKRQGRDPNKAFEPVAYLQKVSELKAAAASDELANRLVAKVGATTAVDGFKLAIKWALHLDPDSVEEQARKNEQRKAEAEKAKADRKREQEEKKAKEAAATLSV